MPIRAEIQRFQHYLTQVCGLQETTCAARVKLVRAFLRADRTTRGIRLTKLTPADLGRFVTAYTTGWAPASQRVVGDGLHSYFRFRALRGAHTAAMAAAIPSVAHWHGARLPQGLTAAEVTRVLAAIDGTAATGQRDYAITRCLVDLGLRTTEVARLRLEDLDWRTGRVSVRGKGHRVDVLPLPAATGRAIAAYLRAGRPPTSYRALFLRHRPPPLNPATVGVVRGAVRRAARRGGVAPCLNGPQVLRQPWPNTSSSAGPPSNRLPISCGTARWIPRRFTPRSTCPPSSGWPSRGQGGGHDGPGPHAREVQAYHMERQRVGFVLSIAGKQLCSIARFADRGGYRGPLTVELASRWAVAHRPGLAHTAARRLEVLRSFARSCQTFDPDTVVPPRSLFDPGHRRLTPHIYTEMEIAALLTVARCLVPTTGVRPHTCATLFGLLAAAALRITEACALQREEVDLRRGILHIRQVKFGKRPLIPLHPSATATLRRSAGAPGAAILPRGSMIFDMHLSAGACAAATTRESTSTGTCSPCPPISGTPRSPTPTGTSRPPRTCWPGARRLGPLAPKGEGR